MALSQHGFDSLATLSLSTADVSVLLRPKMLRVAGRLGNLALSNDNPAYTFREEFNQILSIQGQNFADFRYETYDPEQGPYKGIKSSVYLNAASLKINFLKEPLRDIHLFVTQLARLKGLYDAATQAAVETASTIEMNQMRFEVSIQTPILVFPADPVYRRDFLVMELGKIAARNSPDQRVNKITATLNGIRLMSNLHTDGNVASLQMIEKIDISADILQVIGIDRGTDSDRPDNQVC